MLEGGVVGQSAELLVASLSPAANLIVNNVDLLEAFLEVLIIALDKSQVLVELNDFSVIAVGSGGFTIIGLVDLEVLQLGGELLVVFLEGVDLGLTC